MGWHCDSKYNKNGKFLKNSNSQVINTPVIVFTIGMSRMLKWRKRCLNRNKNGTLIWHYDKSVEFDMLLREGNLMLLHPDDEVPTYCPTVGAVCQYQHGNVCFNEDNGMSVGFVFRNNTSKAIFHNKTNLWIQNQDDVIVPREMYNEVDISKFHQGMISNLEAILDSKNIANS